MSFMTLWGKLKTHAVDQVVNHLPATVVDQVVNHMPTRPPAPTRATPEPIDDDPSGILRRVQSGMVPANLDLPLDEQIEVVGEQYYAKEIRKLFRECGLPITSAGNTVEDEECCLVPEPWNPHDPNAVAVMVRSYHVGHVPAEIARRYHPRLIRYAQQRQLVTGVARVWSRLESGALVRARVTIAVPEIAVLLAGHLAAFRDSDPRGGADPEAPCVRQGPPAAVGSLAGV